MPVNTCNLSLKILIALDFEEYEKDESMYVFELAFKWRQISIAPDPV
jgi:hypothetical protein